MRRVLCLSMMLLLVLVPTALASEVNSYQVSPHSKSAVVVNLNAGSATAVYNAPLGNGFYHNGDCSNHPRKRHIGWGYLVVFQAKEKASFTPRKQSKLK